MSEGVKLIKDLKKYCFNVPLYQRGYRWRKEQVRQLLDDIHESVSEGKCYCIQPIVVTCSGDDDASSGENFWELIDGQQRLTTINLILESCGKERLHIRYERYPGSGSEKEAAEGGTVDDFFLDEARKEIDRWKRIDIHSDFNLITAILEQTQVIWHKVGESDAISEFVRFNSAKIPLSPCELLKAIFLSDRVAVSGDRGKEEISAEWDQMETALQDEGFWHFLNPGTPASEAPNRIALLFELLQPPDPSEGGIRAGETYFKKVSERDNEGSLHKEWRQVRHCFLTLQEWFADKKVRHVVGFLRWARAGGKDVTLLSMWKKAGKLFSRKKFHRWLEEQAWRIIHRGGDEASWEKASYENPKDRPYIQDLLLWFNISTLPPGGVYPFVDHADVDWSLEHIHARATPEDANLEQRRDWINGSIDLLERARKERAKEKHSGFDGKIRELISKLEKLKLIGKLDDPEMIAEILEISSEIDAVLPSGIDGEDGDLDKIWNLALLEKGQNSSLSNHYFHQKRKKILEFERNQGKGSRQGKFVPPATVRVFLKSWSDDPGALMLWAAADRDGYKKALEDVFKKA